MRSTWHRHSAKVKKSKTRTINNNIEEHNCGCVQAGLTKDFVKAHFVGHGGQHWAHTFRRIGRGLEDWRMIGRGLEDWMRLEEEVAIGCEWMLDRFSIDVSIEF